MASARGFVTQAADSVTSLVALVPNVAAKLVGVVTAVASAATAFLETVQTGLESLADRLDDAFGA